MPEEFQPGDLVKVIAPDRDAQYELISHVGFNEDMEDQIGNTFVVDKCFIDGNGYLCYYLEGSGGWTWAHEWLELVKAVHEPKLTEKDFEDAFSFFIY